jgi:RNA polymerase sigma factor (sigma-70 family)
MVISEGTGPPGGADPARVPDLEVLFLAARGGDQGAWDALFHRLSGLVWSICRSYRLSDADAADVFQFTWMRLLDNLDSIKDPRKLPGWMATTCRRECSAMYRRRNRDFPIGEDDILDRFSEPVPGADDPTLVKHRDSAIWEAFFRLGSECQRILWVLVVDPPESGVYAAMSQLLGMPTGSLGPKRGRCLAQLKRQLAPMGITGEG